MEPRRSPVPSSDLAAAYPTLSELGEARRRFLKLCALTSAGAFLGLELTGCPSGGGATGATNRG